jgi:gas vesicle protein
VNSYTKTSNPTNFIQDQSSQVNELQKTNQELTTSNSQYLNKIEQLESGQDSSLLFTKAI